MKPALRHSNSQSMNSEQKLKTRKTLSVQWYFSTSTIFSTIQIWIRRSQSFRTATNKLPLRWNRWNTACVLWPDGKPHPHLQEAKSRCIENTKNPVTKKSICADVSVRLFFLNHRHERLRLQASVTISPTSPSYSRNIPNRQKKRIGCAQSARAWKNIFGNTISSSKTETVSCPTIANKIKTLLWHWHIIFKQFNVCS